MILLESVAGDLRHGIRLLSRNPAFTLLACFTLALGIGVNTAVFTAYRAMILRPLDARHPREMVNLALVDQSGASQFAFSYEDYEAYRDTARSFSGLIAFCMERLTISESRVANPPGSTTSTTPGTFGLRPAGTRNAELASTFVVSENYFSVLGVEGIRGRSFESISVEDLSATPSVLISENYWQRRFGGSPDVLGKTLRLNGAAVVVIGITPHNFMGTGATVPDFWLPIHLAPMVHANANWLHDGDAARVRLFGRLAPGVTIEQAQAEVTLLAGRARASHDPCTESAKSVRAVVWRGSPFPLPIKMYPGVQLAILLVMTAAAMVLVVACANVGGLSLARSRSRLDELHTRLSIGATRGRLVAQLLTESAVLGLIAASLALLFTWALLKVAVTLIAGVLPPEYGTLVFDVTPDLAIFAYVLVVALAAIVLFGLWPALESSRTALVQSSRGATSPARSRRIQEVFVAAQVALTLVLLIAGSLLIRSSINSLLTDPGYDSSQLISVDYDFPESSQYPPDRKQAVVRQMRTALQALPGISAVTSAKAPGDSPFRTAAASVGDPRSTRAERQGTVLYSYIQPNYFETVGIPLARGRGFDSKTDGAGDSVVISESTAALLWPGRNPVGRTVRLGDLAHASRNAQTTRRRPPAGFPGELVANGRAFGVIGVVKDVRGIELDGSASRHVYLVLPDDRMPEYPILIRAKADAAKLSREVDAVVSSIDPDLVTTSSPLQPLVRQSPPFIVSTLSAAVSTTVGLFGLLLASIGIYGTVSYTVAQRTREVGVRMALGAQRYRVVGLILRDSVRAVAGGLLAGIFLAGGASHLLVNVLYGVSSVDALSFAGGSILFLTIAVTAAFVPARRAASIEPTVALRCE